MGGSKTRAYYISLIINLLLLLMPIAIDSSTTLKDVFSGVQKDTARVPRENKYYNTRYGSAVTPINRAIKPEDDRSDHQQAPLEKRCVRCETGYYDSRSYYPYDSRSRYDERRYRDRFDDYDSKYYDRRYDRYDDRDRDRERDRDRDRERDRYYGDRYYIDRYNYDRKPIDYGYDREKDKYDRYDRDRYYDRYYDRGVGYDNRGYDYRDRTDREGYRPWDETYRGSSGFDGSGRGYYFATGRPDYGYGGGNGYASNWNYGHGGGGGGGAGYGGRDDYYNRDSGYGHYRPRDPYDGGYRSTSYLYGRPSTTTTNRPNTSENDSVTQNPQQDNNTSG